LHQTNSTVVDYAPIGGRNDYETLVLEAIDQTFCGLGEKVRDSIYAALKRKYALNKEEIACKPATFTAAIENLFGPGADVLEIKMMQAITRKVNGFTFSPIDSSLNFVEYLTALRKYLNA
jgi:hypothetical protein